MSKLQFDVFAGVTPNGSSIGTFTEAFGQWIRVPNNDLGEGGFTINRHSAEIALAATDNYVRVKRTGGAYVGAFWIETGQDSLVSPDEEGAEDYVRSGRGPLAYLERAILMPTETAAGPGAVGTDGNWAWTNQTIGAILNHIFLDVTTISPSGVPELTWDFDATNDSAGNPWDTIDDTFQLPIGMDILSVVSRFQSAGVTIRMDDDFTLHAWNDPPGADLAGTVSFVKGVNVRDAADRQVHASPAKTRVVVQGTTVAGTLKFRTVTSPAYTSGLETAIGVRYGFTQYGATPSNTMLDRAGRQLIKKLKRQKDGPSAIGVLNTPVPFTDYAPGDTVNVDIPGGLDDLNVELAAIYLGDDESDGYLTTVEFEDAPYDPLEGMKTGSTSTSGSGGGLGGGGGSGGGSGGGAATCGDCGSCDECGSVAGPTILGTDLGTETWTDAEDQVFISHEFSAGGEVGDSAFFAGEIAPPVAGNSHDVPAFNDAIIGRYYLSHDAPVGASHARLRCDIIAERLQNGMENTTVFAIRKGVWGAAANPAFGDFSDTLHSGTISAQWTSAMGGAEPYIRYPIDCWIPVVAGRAQFVLEAGTDATFEGSPHQDHRVFLVTTGIAPVSDTTYYELTFYGPHTTGVVGNAVSPVAVGTGDGYSTTFRTPFAYKPGSIAPEVNGVGQEVIETDPASGTFNLAYPPAVGGVVRTSFIIASTTETGVPIPDTGAELGPDIPAVGSDIQDVGTANAPGSNPEVARDDHVHEGVHSVAKSGSTALVGDVTFSAGANVTLTQAGQDIAIASSGGGGGGGGWSTFSTDGVTLDSGRIYVYDAFQDAYILMDGVIALTAGSGYGIELQPDTGQVVEITGGDGLRFRNLGADPTAIGDGQVYYHSTDDMLRIRQNGRWVYIPWQGPSGSATITSGNTSVTVTHGAGFDPISARGVSVWPINNPTNDPGWFWVSNIDATSFDINVRANPGASGAIFAWRVVPT